MHVLKSDRDPVTWTVCFLVSIVYACKEHMFPLCNMPQTSEVYFIKQRLVMKMFFISILNLNVVVLLQSVSVGHLTLISNKKRLHNISRQIQCIWKFSFHFVVVSHKKNLCYLH